MRTQLVKAKNYKDAKRQMPWAYCIVEVYNGWRGFDSPDSFTKWTEG
jgi:hypothetical protein